MTESCKNKRVQENEFVSKYVNVIKDGEKQKNIHMYVIYDCHAHYFSSDGIRDSVNKSAVFIHLKEVIDIQQTIKREKFYLHKNGLFKSLDVICYVKIDFNEYFVLTTNSTENDYSEVKVKPSHNVNEFNVD